MIYEELSQEKETSDCRPDTPLVILHTESSPGWGGQEIRILKEAMGMRERGHTVIFALQKKTPLFAEAKKEGFKTYEISFAKSKALFALCKLLKIIYSQKVTVINTHSSLDAWIAGIAARLLCKPLLRTRHLSTSIRGGMNRFLLYRCLADTVITTCEETAVHLRKEGNFSIHRCHSIPTGVDPKKVNFDEAKVRAFRRSLGLKPDECLAGTLCVMRGWKGISDLLLAAKELETFPFLKWLVIGGGVSEAYFKKQMKELGLERKVIFTGHLESPFVALASIDIFLLLSWANEGVSQASLQAAWLRKPLITTSIGGLPEVCINGRTGIIVPPRSPHNVALAVKKLALDPYLRGYFGRNAKQLVKEQFLFCETLDKMETAYYKLCQTKKHL